MAAPTSDEDLRLGPVRYASLSTWCAQYSCPAVVSMVDRDDVDGGIRFVLWCSLRRCGACSEHCLRAPVG
ncbi:MAG: hypothetical protein ACRERC_02030 [Candidatus Binatia bacterium]